VIRGALGHTHKGDSRETLAFILFSPNRILKLPLTILIVKSMLADSLFCGQFVKNTDNL